MNMTRNNTVPDPVPAWQVDTETLHRGKYLFEKLISGLYLGDVARRILLTLAKDENVMLFGPSSGSPSKPAGAAAAEAEAAEKEASLKK